MSQTETTMVAKAPLGATYKGSEGSCKTVDRDGNCVSPEGQHLGILFQDQFLLRSPAQFSYQPTFNYWDPIRSGRIVFRGHTYTVLDGNILDQNQHKVGSIVVGGGYEFYYDGSWHQGYFNDTQGMAAELYWDQGHPFYDTIAESGHANLGDHNYMVKDGHLYAENNRTTPLGSINPRGEISWSNGLQTNVREAIQESVDVQLQDKFRGITLEMFGIFGTTLSARSRIYTRQERVVGGVDRVDWLGFTVVFNGKNIVFEVAVKPLTGPFSFDAKSEAWNVSQNLRSHFGEKRFFYKDINSLQYPVTFNFSFVESGEDAEMLIFQDFSKQCREGENRQCHNVRPATHQISAGVILWYEMPHEIMHYLGAVDAYHSDEEPERTLRSDWSVMNSNIGSIQFKDFETLNPFVQSLVYPPVVLIEQMDSQPMGKLPNWIPAQSQAKMFQIKDDSLRRSVLNITKQIYDTGMLRDINGVGVCVFLNRSGFQVVPSENECAEDLFLPAQNK